MKCEFCKKADATVEVKQVSDGEVKSVFLCAKCAEKSGLKAPDAIADFLFGLGSVDESPLVSQAEVRQCAACGLSLAEFKKRNRAGCEACYEVFEPELRVMIGDMQRADKHCGKIPERELSRSELVELKICLLQAVKKQAFEEAAELRDRIRELEREQ